MGRSRLCHLRTLNRFEFWRPYTGRDKTVMLHLKPRGFNVKLLGVEIEVGSESAAKDVADFFDAVAALSRTPPPERKRKKARR